MTALLNFYVAVHAFCMLSFSQVSSKLHIFTQIMNWMVRLELTKNTKAICTSCTPQTPDETFPTT